jgi:queuosine precursor transporter
VIGKIYGKELAKKFVFLGFSALLLWTIFTLITMALPWASQSYGRVGVAYDTLFTLSIRIVFASLIGFLVSEYLDVIVFFRLKNKKSSFWLASFFSNLVSQFLDTIIFMSIAFVGFYDTEKILMMALPYWLYKVSM